MAVGRGGAPASPGATSAADGAGVGTATSEETGGDGVTATVKLVVWDLDETLWSGTLSEGPVTLEAARADVVRTLNRRGIVNSICSNNDEGAARARLRDAGLDDEFVFARIDWTPKGPRVAQIVEDAQLRPENVLFIDDLPMNRREVRHFVPGIQTADPDIGDQLLSLPELQGKDDRALTRLEQYRVLERKLADRRRSSGGNESFLRGCDIRIGIFRETEDETERLYELATRTHQLNFTKRRPTRDEFGAMLVDPAFDTGYVRVRDRYGDYGICGFFSVDRERDEVVDLLFSCRVLHMGVEQWVYEHLGHPAVTVVGEVASALDGPVDWIELDSAAFDDRVEPSDTAGGGRADTLHRRVLMIGGCDLTTTAQYLGGQIVTDFSYPGPTGAFIHVGHTELLRQSATGISEAAAEIVDRIPFVDREIYASPAVVNPEYDLLVYSVLTDYTQGLYRHRQLGLVVPWHQHHVDATNEAFWPWILKRSEREGIDAAFLTWFADEFEFLGPIAPEQFASNLAWLSRAVPPAARVILLNGAEIPLDNPREPDRYLRHRVMNDALDSVVATLSNTTVCDVRTLVRGPEDLAGNLRHYQRHVYLAMADQIRASGASELRFRRERLGARTAGNVYKFAGRRRLQLRRWRKRLRRAS